ncbi:hypothetical protein LL912_02370 [Niabella sp. CC-SYL272]|uniref:hypothetical protein n=1 Tax=Niabella agricola TaxID=2891571 RepID=UPI001F260DD5|nr:hypothetical protein [Niabella agricola]MCF3107615.1 hypothetical protein [Niabella agricola]
MARSDKDLPLFIVYQPNAKEFHICLEVGGMYYAWVSNYPPTRDPRFARKVIRLRAILPKEIPGKQVYDKGRYTVNKGDDRAAVEKKVKAGIKQRSFSFIFQGQRLKGRFILKRTSSGTVLQKFKDQFAVEEDVLGADLSRTIRLMVPDYNPDSIKLRHSGKQKERPGLKKKKTAGTTELQAAEPPTAEMAIGHVHYHFAFYRSDGKPELCVIFNSRNDVLVLELQKGKWQPLKAIKGIAHKNAAALAAHALALSQYQPEK